jgi:hypothetical protein
MVTHPNRRRKVIETVAAVDAAVDASISDHDADWLAFRTSVQAAFDAHSADDGPLFCTDATGLYDAYLDALPAERAIHSCSACRRFFEIFGGLATIGAGGDIASAMWSYAPDVEVPGFYVPAVIALSKRVRNARVTGPFFSADPIWGMPQTRERAKGLTWSHLAVDVPKARRYAGKALTAAQAMAAKREDFGTVARALAEFKPAALDDALRVLRADAVCRAERFVAPLEWLRRLCDRPKGRAGENVLWRAVASAPEGFCHPRAAVTGTLVEDLAAGMEFEDVKNRFDAKMHPLRYQRPQAAPAAGNIKAAEALVEKLGIARSLERRFARLDDLLETLWAPPAKAERAPAGGVFGHLKPRGEVPRPTVDLPTATVTWEKFRRTVLAPETVEAIEFLAPMSGDYAAYVTAAHADAPPILKWDRDDHRNPVSVYLYHEGSHASRWGVAPGWAKVNAVAERPNLWGRRLPELGESILLVLDGARDSGKGQGNALFPETLKAELHGARVTIEAYSKSAVLGGYEEASACGYCFGKGAIGVRLRIFAFGAWSEYKIDRWD